MTKVHGQVFPDGRSGNLVIKPSQPFFGVTRHEILYPVIDGCIDIDLTPTPTGAFYLVGFKPKGDVRRTDFTLKWRIPNVPDVDISPKPSEPLKPTSTTDSQAKVIIAALNLKLQELESKIQEKDQSISHLSSRLAEAIEQIDNLSVALDTTVVDRNNAYKELEEINQPLVETKVEYVPVANSPLIERIHILESKLSEVVERNARLESTIAQLHQLQLKHSYSAPVNNQRLTDDWLRQNIKKHFNNNRKSWR